MKRFSLLALFAAMASTALGTTINLSTGNAAWQVSGPGVVGTVAATSLTVAQQNGTWAAAPISIDPISGSNWISWGSVEGTSCVVGQTPGNGCANANFNAGGDVWTYSLNISAATLGSTSGIVNFIFGADSAVILNVGSGLFPQAWTGPNPLACSNSAGATNAGSTQASYNNCTTTMSFGAANLNGDGSLTITALVTNSPIVGCPTCGNPTGFVLEGTLSTDIRPTPEPTTFSMLGIAGLAGLVLRKRRS